MSAGRRLVSVLIIRASAISGKTLWAAVNNSIVVRTEIGERSSLSISLAPMTSSSGLRGTIYTR